MIKALVCTFTLLRVIFAMPTVTLTVRNDAGKPINLYWKDKKEMIKITTEPIQHSMEMVFNSFAGHQFSFQDLYNDSSVRFVKGVSSEFITIVEDRNDGLKVSRSDDALAMKHVSFEKIHKDRVLDNRNPKVQVDDKGTLTQTIHNTTTKCISSPDFKKCVAENVYQQISDLVDSKEQLEKYRDQIASRLRNYTCADKSMEQSDPIAEDKVMIDGVERTSKLFFSNSHAKILAVEDFITDEECAVLAEYGSKRLLRATVAAEDGSSTISASRKAQQAGYDVRDENDPLWPLYNRILSFTNGYTGYNLQPEGQESFTILQYNPGDEYLPHCDGSCDGEPHMPGGRVATAVTYCQPASVGGATAFTKANVFIKPKKGMAAFFSYLGSDGKMDDGYSEHTACPVVEGEKWITVFWMRVGVTEQRPWTTFDPSGVPLMDD